MLRGQKCSIIIYAFSVKYILLIRLNGIIFCVIPQLINALNANVLHLFNEEMAAFRGIIIRHGNCDNLYSLIIRFSSLYVVNLSN